MKFKNRLRWQWISLHTVAVFFTQFYYISMLKKTIFILPSDDRWMLFSYNVRTADVRGSISYDVVKNKSYIPNRIARNTTREQTFVNLSIRQKMFWKLRGSTAVTLMVTVAVAFPPPRRPGTATIVAPV